ncbi:fungal symportin 1-like domain-containing protein [Phanerochaete sordida]|uniref:Fungal symportin 1-like domain-containing protein n=1 Tax=Phanerochaete sordida TaxID=48140 RepID=A0A9P3G800_9APHY|nr:fungal symportin 1-like domain-containing protein [Phanerochaete sordida]
MGKSQKKRQMRRHNPVRVPDSHLPKGLDSASASSSKREAILPIMQKMESPDAAERKWACVAVSNLIQNDPSTRRLLQGKDIVGTLITRLSDSEEEVVVEAAGSLRNLCIDGGYDICAEMYNKNILSPLKTFIPKISGILSQYLENPKTAPENAQKLVYEFADNVITILWCLSETSNKALNAINQIGLVPFLMSFLGSKDKLLLSTITSAAQSLYVLTDDNPPISNEVRSNGEYTACLLAIARGDEETRKPNGKGKDVSDDRETALRVLCTGILRNVSPIPPPSVAAMVDIDNELILPTLLPVISSVSLSEISQRVQELIAQEDAVPEMEKLSLKGTPKSDHKSPAELELERLERHMRTVQLAVEILTGVSATLPDPEPEVEDDAEAQDDGMDEDGDDEAEGSDEEADIEPQPQRNAAPSALPTIVEPLLALIQPTPLSFPPTAGAASPHPPTTSALSAIHICALECLNNIFLSLATPAQLQGRGFASDADREAGPKIWDAVWRALAAVGTDVDGPGQERRRDVWQIGVGVLWGIAILWKGILVPQVEQVNVLVQLCTAASDPAVKVKCIGTLECLAQHPQSIDGNRMISQFLVSLLAQPAAVPTEPLLQAASALIDIYSDETAPYDVVFRQGGYLQALTAAVEPVRKVVRGIDRKRERDLRRRGEEVRDNLVAFVEYRRALRL